ncbi:LuxR C-terminal-related transcriptional regulator [Beutenbergia cavernae]|uniref:LuxR C-terminal-related transcriptional regulator n=1 Tax=Beutenbergia cavernae TaxID=84757 RepID=UPI00030B9814|nr:LuxR C-terminal-related transcriptional regulator [Beutenbergia cavernae]
MTLLDVPRPVVPRYKVTVPRRGEATIARPRLSAMLDDAVASRPVSHVAAPAGFGKSTAAAAWAADRSDVAWLSLDPYDADPRRLYRGVLAAIATALADDELPAPLAAVLRPGVHPRDPEDAIDLLDGVLEALDDLRRPLVLVVDDVHHVPPGVARPVVRAVLSAGLPTTNVLLLSRDASHLDGLDLDATVTGADLGFTAEEIVTLSGSYPPGLTQAQAVSLHDETRGWPAAVRMSLIDRPDRDAAERRGTPATPATTPARAVAAHDEAFGAYLHDEVLGALPRAVAAFVRRATTSTVITASLAIALTGDDGARLLAATLRRGLFLTPLGRRDGEDVYRWHDLFASWCRSRLEHEDPALARDLHGRAARFWGARHLPESVPHALAAGDSGAAVDLLVEGALEALLNGGAAELLELCEALPPTARDDARVVAIRSVAARMSGRRDEAASLLERARAQLADHDAGDADGSHALAVAMLETFVAGPSSAPDAAERLLASPAALHPAVRAGLLYHLGRRATRRQQDPRGALHLLDEAVSLAERHGLDGVALASRAERASALVDAAEPVLAEQAITDVLERAEISGWAQDARLALLRLEAGVFAYWRDEFDVAQRHFTLVTRARGDDEAVASLGSLYGALASIATGDAGGAAAAAQGISQGLASLPLEAMHALLRLKTAEAAGDVASAVREADLIGRSPCMPFAVVWQAEVFRVAGRAERARNVLASLRAVPVRAHVRVAAELTGALLDAADGGDPLPQIVAGLHVAAPSRFTRPYLERLPDLRPYLEALVHAGTDHRDFLTGLLGTPAADGAPHRRSHWELTDRELEILDGLRSSLTAAEIARSLFVSVNTVKTHQRAVYRKLGARNRREAVRLAASRGFLPA